MRVVGRQGQRARTNARRFGLPLLPGTEVLQRRRPTRVARGAIASASRSSSRLRAAAAGAACASCAASRGRACVRAARRAKRWPASRTPTSTWSSSSSARGTSSSRCSPTTRRRVDARRARVLAAAPPPEGDGRVAEPGDDAGASGARWARSSARPSARPSYTTLGTLEFLMDERRAALLHGDEHARAGRAPGHRDGHRRRPGASSRSAPPRARSSSCPTRGRGASAATPSSAASTPRTRRRSRRGRGSSPSTIPPGGTGVRVDSGVYGGWRVPPHYDSLIAKVIVHAPTREEAIARMRARARRVHRRRHPHQHPAAQAAPRRPRGHRRRRCPRAPSSASSGTASKRFARSVVRPSARAASLATPRGAKRYTLAGARRAGSRSRFGERSRGGARLSLGR